MFRWNFRGDYGTLMEKYDTGVDIGSRRKREDTEDDKGTIL